jgi:hypothetical protein
MRRIRAFVVLLAVTALALASSESTADLKARADGTHGGEQAKSCMEYAHRILEDANGLFTNGDVDKAQAEIREVVEYARKGADAASTSGKRQKQTEIALRELAKHMRDIGDTLAFEDRGPVRHAVDEIEQTRSALLTRMFQN